MCKGEKYQKDQYILVKKYLFKDITAMDDNNNGQFNGFQYYKRIFDFPWISDKLL